MKLVDSSAWVHCLRRRGEPKIVDRVRRLVESGAAAWCPVIRLELWNGVGDESDRRILRDFEETLPELPITDDVWAAACALASRCRKTGRTAPPLTSSLPPARGITASMWSTPTVTSISS